MAGLEKSKMVSNMASENEKTHILVTKNDTEACNTSNQGFLGAEFENVWNKL